MQIWSRSHSISNDSDFEFTTLIKLCYFQSKLIISLHVHIYSFRIIKKKINQRTFNSQYKYNDRSIQIKNRTKRHCS